MCKQKKFNLYSYALLMVGLLAGCAQTNEAPVETRGGFGRTAAVDPATLPGAENAGKPGYYTVRPGDTLIRIGLEHGQSWKDIAQWSRLSNPNVIEIGQVVRVAPPGTAPGEGRATPAATAPVQATPLPPVGATASAAGTSSTNTAATSSTNTAATSSTNTAATSSTSAAPSADVTSLGLVWPAAGNIISSFNETTNKGVDIAGKAGDPIVAAAAGKVIYVGEMRGYGQLIIIQHSKDYLTAYAHNQKMLIKEEQTVKKGQNIAQMGSSDTDRVKLHFELRRQGKPIDPVRYLPAR